MALVEERRRCEQLYVEEGLKPADIAARLGVDVKRVYYWVNEDGLEEKRKAMSSSSFAIMKEMLDAAVAGMQEITKALRTDGLAALDSQKLFALNTTIRETKKMLKDYDRGGDFLLVVTRLIEFMQKRDPEFLKTQMLPYLIEFKEEIKKEMNR